MRKAFSIVLNGVVVDSFARKESIVRAMKQGRYDITANWEIVECRPDGYVLREWAWIPEMERFLRRHLG